ncbi:Gfo/Idh/MocA family oxidoreductase [Aeromicrobium sp.]|uniref:Gfo/Idh/MocA family oxidoreductase n=1 Tax=Aeromicrobium sp. TaxID=1871063 RepID=UPI004034C942
MSKRLKVGVVGAGAMGAAHVRTLATSVPGAEVTRVFDMDTARAQAVAAEVGGEAAASPEALIADVDAFVVASPDFTHADLAIAGIEAGKHVLCEKPLAVTADDARRVVDAEVAAGRRFVQVGFNRRFDPGFVDLKGAIVDGSLGEVKLLHGIHRNATNTTSTDSSTLVTGSMIHEFDTFRWLLDDEIAAIRVESPIAEGFKDPQVATIWMAAGQMITAEVYCNAAYGYDVRVEVVGDGGSAMLEPRPPVVRRLAGQSSTTIGSDFVEHFIESYRLELSAWVDASLRGEVVGASAWDGFAANLVAASGVAALDSGAREPVVVPERPALYA